ncbi:conjugal transfer protein TraN [Acidithiobacillus sp. M4-SHS-6]|uniref:conjugal transfer protein TraN n=1 Tax=Acidithiobacillus sp. M4-SHS-6 TaxID=3383024 RepID=UPI0039BE13B2
MMKTLFAVIVSLILMCGVAEAGCQLSAEHCETKSNGVCIQEHLTYTCTTQTHTCASYSTTTSGACTQNMAGTQNQTAHAPNNNSFDDAMKDLALLNAVKKDLTGIHPIRIFGGKYYNCVNPLASGVGMTQNCCESNLKPSSHGLFVGCAKEAVKLAGYVRAGTAYEFSSNCDGGLSLFGSCVVCAGNQQDYCAFDNKLAEIIQVKGRAQLAALAAAGYAGATSGSKQTFTYYTKGITNTHGHWVAFPALNHNQVWVWQWPGACNSDSAGSTLKCPSQPNLGVAFCNKSDCVTPTASPMGSTPKGDEIVYIHPEKDASHAISKYVVLTGDCKAGTGGTDTCTYIESAYPGVGNGGAGDAVLRAKLTFPLYVYSQGHDDGYLTSTATANAEFWGQSLPMSDQGKGLPSTVNVAYTLGDVESGNLTAGNAQHTVALPTHITMTSDDTLTGNAVGRIVVFGGCSVTTNLCTYTFEVPANVHAKPWYTASHGGPCNHTPKRNTIDCSGFTLQEFEELNLAKMHLGRVLLSMAPKAPSKSAEQSIAEREAASQADNPESPVAAASS